MNMTEYYYKFKKPKQGSISVFILYSLTRFAHKLSLNFWFYFAKL